MRHGEAENNTQGVMSSKAYDQKHLTEKERASEKISSLFWKQKMIYSHLTVDSNKETPMFLLPV